MTKSFTNAERIFIENNGILRTGQAKRLGIDPKILARMVGAGLLVKESRGLYRLANLPPLSNPDLVNVALKVPHGVVCLLSALSFHNMTTQMPYKVYIAIPLKYRIPKFEYPPIDVFRVSENVYNAGIEEHDVDGVNVRIYNKEKTIADCFKFRKKIGKNIAIEALKDYIRDPGSKIESLLVYAEIDRVSNIMQPFIEAIE